MQQIKYKEDRTLKMGHTIVVDEKYSVEITKLEATWSLTSTYEVDVDYTIELKLLMNTVKHYVFTKTITLKTWLNIQIYYWNSKT